MFIEFIRHGQSIWIDSAAVVCVQEHGVQADNAPGKLEAEIVFANYSVWVPDADRSALIRILRARGSNDPKYDRENGKQHELHVHANAER